MKKFLYTLFVFTTSLSYAQDWTGLNGSYGGHVNDILIHSSGTYLAATTSGGVFRSTDAGVTWTRSTIPATQVNFSDLEVDGTGKIFACTGNLIFTSVDQGANFTQLTSTGLSGTIKRLKVSPATNLTIYVITNSFNFFRSTNGGALFASPSTLPSTPLDLDVNTGSVNQVLVATQNSGLQISANSGTGFAAAGTPLNSGQVSSLVVNQSSGAFYAIADFGNPTTNGPYRSINNGANWTLIDGTIPDGNISGVIDLDGSGNLVIADNISRKVFVTSNPTASPPTWSAGASYPYAFDVTCLQLLTAGNWIIGQRVYGFSKTTNSGVAWSPFNNGIRANNFNRIHWTTNNRLFQTVPDLYGYYLSIDDGNTWDVFATGNANRRFTGFLTLGNGNTIGYGPDGTVLTGDFGNNWTVQSATPIYDVVTSNGTTLYNASGTTIQTSINNGAVWNGSAITGLTGTTGGIYRIQVDASDNAYLVCRNTTTAFYELYKVASGTTNAVKNTALPITTIADIKVVGNLITVVGGTTLAKSIDGGTSWSQVTMPFSALSTVASGSSLTPTFSVWAVDANNIAVAPTTNGTLYTTSDGGLTWRSRPLLDGNSKVTDLTLTTQLTAYVAVDASVVHKSTTAIAIPAAPTGLNIIARDLNAVHLSWTDNSKSEQGYRIEYSIGNNTSWQPYLSTPQFFLTKGNYFAIGNPTTTYYYRVAAYNTAGQSPYSNEVSGTSLPVCAPDPPNEIPDNRSWTITAVADPGSTTVNAGPFVVTNAVVRRSTQNSYTFPTYGAGMQIAVRGTPQISANFFLTVSCDQVYQDNAFGTSQDIVNGNGTWNSIAKTFTVKWRINPGSYANNFEATTTYALNATDPPPAVPVLNAYNYSATEAFLNWSAPNFASQFVLERSTTPGTGFAPVATLNFPTVQFTNTNLTTGQIYYYRVKASNAWGTSAYSAEASITPGNSLFTPVQCDVSLNFESAQGASWGDLDGDGDEDLALASFTSSLGAALAPVFYENLGSSQFLRRDLAVLAEEPYGVSRGIFMADFNNDGKLDMLIARTGSNLPDIYLINNGAWSFTRYFISEVFPVSTFKGASLADIDRDGKIDIYLGNDLQTAPGSNAYVLKNVDGVSFSKVTTGALATDLNNTRSSSFADYDNDGDQDLFVVNFQSPAVANRLYRNNGSGDYTLVTGLVFDSDTPHMNGARPISWGDIDNDQDLDLFVGSTGAEADRLYRNNGNGTFTRMTGNAAEEASTGSFGSAMGDIDNDGDIDLIVVNSLANGIFLNDGTGVFTKSSSQEMLTNPALGEVGGTMGDFNKDGFLDFIAGKLSGAAVDMPNQLYKNNLTPSASRNWIQIKLVGTTSNRAAIGARIKVITTSPARTQIREVSATAGYASQNSLIQHFGLGTATTITSVQVTWPNGGIQNFPPPTINQIITLTEDVVGPLMTLTPANGASAAAVGNTLEITLNEAGTKVTGKKVTIRSGSPASTPIQVIDLSAGVAGTGNKFTFTLAASLNYLTTYYISVDAGAFLDAFQNPSLAVDATAWSFTTQDEADVVAPTIVFTPVQSFDKGFGNSQKFEVTASDNKGVTSMIMFYRKATATTISQFPGIFNAATAKYDFPLQETFFDDMGMEYAFEAKDAANNATKSPVGAGTYHFTRLKFSDTNTGVPIIAGSSVNDYQIKSIPYDVSSNQINILFDELGAPDIKQWRMLKYKNVGTPDWDEYPANFNTIARGEGIFIISRTAQNVKLGATTAPNFTQGTLFQMSLKQGWNLIGNPYTMGADWEASRTGFPAVGKLKVFSGGAYVDDADGVMNLFEGGFVLAQSDITVPVKLKTSLNGGRINTASSDLGEEEWLVPISIVQGERMFRLGGVGMHPNAKTSFDTHDDFAPPTMFESIEVQFDHPEHFMKHFALDVVNTQNEYTWEFKVNTKQEGTAELQWNNADFGSNTRELYLLDVSREQLINMREQSGHMFDPKKSTSFRVYYGTELDKKVRPGRVTLGDAFPNPSTAFVTIPFTVSGKSDSYLVQLDVYDMMGRKVTTLVNGEVKAGFYTSIWDADRSNSGNGLYTYRLAVVSDDKQEVLSGKVILKK